MPWSELASSNHFVGIVLPRHVPNKERAHPIKSLSLWDRDQCPGVIRLRNAERHRFEGDALGDAANDIVPEHVFVRGGDIPYPIISSRS